MSVTLAPKLCFVLSLLLLLLVVDTKLLQSFPGPRPGPNGPQAPPAQGPPVSNGPPYSGPGEYPPVTGPDGHHPPPPPSKHEGPPASTWTPPIHNRPYPKVDTGSTPL